MPSVKRKAREARARAIIGVSGSDGGSRGSQFPATPTPPSTQAYTRSSTQGRERSSSLETGSLAGSPFPCQSVHRFVRFASREARDGFDPPRSERPDSGCAIPSDCRLGLVPRAAHRVSHATPASTTWGGAKHWLPAVAPMAIVPPDADCSLSVEVMGAAEAVEALVPVRYEAVSGERALARVVPLHEAPSHFALRGRLVPSAEGEPSTCPRTSPQEKAVSTEKFWSQAVGFSRRPGMGWIGPIRRLCRSSVFRPCRLEYTGGQAEEPRPSRNPRPGLRRSAAMAEFPVTFLTGRPVDAGRNTRRGFPFASGRDPRVYLKTLR